MACLNRSASAEKYLLHFQKSHKRVKGSLKHRAGSAVSLRLGGWKRDGVEANLASTGKERASEQSLYVGLGLGTGGRDESHVEAGCRDWCPPPRPPRPLQSHATTIASIWLWGFYDECSVLIRWGALWEQGYGLVLLINPSCLAQGPIHSKSSGNTGWWRNGWACGLEVRQLWVQGPALFMRSVTYFNPFLVLVF